MSWKNTEEGMRRNTLLHERGLKKHVAYIRRAVRFTAAGRIEGGSLRTIFGAAGAAKIVPTGHSRGMGEEIR